MRRAALCLAALLLSACAALGPNTSAGDVDSIIAGTDRPDCQSGMVTLYVVNDHSGDVETSLRHRPFIGLKTDSIRVSRYELRRPIALRIARGGMNVGRTPLVETETVSCNAATLFIGDPLSQSFFFGADVRRRR